MLYHELGHVSRSGIDNTLFSRIGAWPLVFAMGWIMLHIDIINPIAAFVGLVSILIITKLTVSLSEHAFALFKASNQVAEEINADWFSLFVLSPREIEDFVSIYKEIGLPADNRLDSEFAFYRKQFLESNIKLACEGRVQEMRAIPPQSPVTSELGLLLLFICLADVISYAAFLPHLALTLCVGRDYIFAAILFVLGIVLSVRNSLLRLKIDAAVHSRN